MKDPEDRPPALSQAAREALERSEQKAAERREKALAKDALLKQRAMEGTSPLTSGLRIDPDGARAPGAVADPMPESTRPPTPHSMRVAGPKGPTAAELLVPADSQQAAREEAGRAAFALVEEQRSAADASRHKVRADVMFYVRCHRCGGPGIWMVTRGALGPGDWWSNYKPRGVPWPSRDIWCQCCWAIAGSQNPLKILHTTVNDRVVSVSPYPRMVVEISTSEYARLVAAPEPQPMTADGESGP